MIRIPDHMGATLWAQEISQGGGFGPWCLVAICECKAQARAVARSEHQSLTEPAQGDGDPFEAHAILGGGGVISYRIGHPSTDTDRGPASPREWW